MGVLTRLTKSPKAKGINTGYIPKGGEDRPEVMMFVCYPMGLWRPELRRYTKKARALYELLVPSFRGSDKAFLAGEGATQKPTQLLQYRHCRHRGKAVSVAVTGYYKPTGVLLLLYP